MSLTVNAERRRRWKVTLYNPVALGRLPAGFETGPVSAEASTMRRAFHRALTAAGAEYLTHPHDYCGTAYNCFEAAREGMRRYPGHTARVAVQDRGFTVEIERIR